jgi:hypothetical protein
MDIHVQWVMQLLSARRYQDPTKDRPLTPHFIFFSGTGPRSVQGPIYLRPLPSANFGGVVRRSNLPPAMKTLPALRTHAA